MAEKKSEEGLKIGIEIEKEHKPTFLKIKEYYETEGDIPSEDLIYEWIALDHLNEFEKYYDKDVGLPKMEENLSKIESILKAKIDEQTSIDNKQIDYEKYNKNINNFLLFNRFKETLINSKLVQKNNNKTGRKEWALVSKNNPSKVLKWFGTEKPSKNKIKKEEKRVQYFKNIKSKLEDVKCNKVVMREFVDNNKIEYLDDGIIEINDEIKFNINDIENQDIDYNLKNNIIKNINILRQNNKIKSASEWEERKMQEDKERIIKDEREKANKEYERLIKREGLYADTNIEKCRDDIIYLINSELAGVWVSDIKMDKIKGLKWFFVDDYDDEQSKIIKELCDSYGLNFDIDSGKIYTFEKLKEPMGGEKNEWK